MMKEQYQDNVSTTSNNVIKYLYESRKDLRASLGDGNLFRVAQAIHSP